MNAYEKKEILLCFKKQKKRKTAKCNQEGVEQKISAAIFRLDDEKQKKAMLLRYMDGMSVERAAEQMNMSPRQVIRITNKALEELVL